MLQVCRNLSCIINGAEEIMAYFRAQLGINHLEGHVYANWLDGGPLSEDPSFPLVALIVSGGHSDLVLSEGHGRYRRLGRTQPGQRPQYACSQRGNPEKRNTAGNHNFG